MNTAAVRITRVFAVLSSNPARKRIRNTSAFLRKLSLNAEKNWHQNKGAKRRDVISELDIGLIPSRANGSGYSDCRPGRSAARDDSGSLLVALDSHQQALGARILDSVHELSAFVHVAQRLGHGDAGLDQQCRSHAEVRLDPHVHRRE